MQAFWQASIIIQFHVFAALVAFVLAVVQFSMPKGTRGHRVFGYAWCLLMMLTAISSLWINTIKVWGPFSPIHFLSLVTMIGVPYAVLLVRLGEINRHRRSMIMLFTMALLGAGTVAALMPGRLMHHVLFGG